MTQPLEPILFPEVMDLFCRHPLPMLFYQLEAVHLGDLMQLSVQPGVRPPCTPHRHPPPPSHTQSPSPTLLTPTNTYSHKCIRTDINSTCLGTCTCSREQSPSGLEDERVGGGGYISVVSSNRLLQAIVACEDYTRRMQGIVGRA